MNDFRTDLERERGLKLSREQRAKFFAGGCPHIHGTGPCPLKAGDTYRLSNRLSFRVSRVDTDRKGWSLWYTVFDNRDNIRNLRRTPQTFGSNDYEKLRESFDEYGYPPPPKSEDETSQESSYTAAPTSLSDAGEAVDAQTNERFAQQARRDSEHADELAQARRERYSLSRRLQFLEQAELDGVDISSPLRVIERQLAKAERRVHQGRAA